jgi:hypothetical protein
MSSGASSTIKINGRFAIMALRLQGSLWGLFELIGLMGPVELMRFISPISSIGPIGPIQTNAES